MWQIESKRQTASLLQMAAAAAAAADDATVMLHCPYQSH
jgi:hypothetical protein